MNNIITLVVGDWSGDGHNEKDSFNIKSNLNEAEIEKAYKKATKKLGFDFCETIASEYQDNKFPEDQWEKIKSLGYKDADLIEKEAKEYNDGEISLDVGYFLDIYLFIVYLGNNNFKFEYMTRETNPTINIGGYGLFQ